MKNAKYTVKPTTQFKKDYKLAMRRGLDIHLLEGVIADLAMGIPLPEKNRDHALSAKAGRTARTKESARNGLSRQTQKMGTTNQMGIPPAPANKSKTCPLDADMYSRHTSRAIHL